MNLKRRLAMEGEDGQQAVAEARSREFVPERTPLWTPLGGLDALRATMAAFRDPALATDG